MSSAMASHVRKFRTEHGRGVADVLRVIFSLYPKNLQQIKVLHEIAAWTLAKAEAEAKATSPLVKAMLSAR
jgi:hypothetical protein